MVKFAIVIKDRKWCCGIAGKWNREAANIFTVPIDQVDALCCVEEHLQFAILKAIHLVNIAHDRPINVAGPKLFARTSYQVDPVIRALHEDLLRGVGMIDQDSRPPLDQWTNG